MTIFSATCIICHNKNLSSYFGITAPFIASYALKKSPFVNLLHECLQCGHRFFAYRYTDEEMQHLYKEYRSNSYQKARAYWEPWYTAKFNQSLSDDSDVIAQRNEQTLQFLTKYLPESVFQGKILDYGGDKGQYIPLELGSQKFVYDLSNATPLPHVIKILNPEDIRSINPHLIMLLNILEHVAYPQEFMALVQKYAPNTSYFYVEVPYERPRILKHKLSQEKQQQYQKFLKPYRFTRYRLPWICMDFVATLARVKFSTVLPFVPLKSHEHISFFCEKSLITLFERANCSLLGIQVDKASKNAKTIRAIFKKAEK